jgi:hypothetical protein
MHVPTASEIATFDGTSQASCLLDAPTVGTNTVSGINISAAYNGVITAGADLVVGTDGFRQAAGTFAATSFKITDSGNWSESSPMGFAAGTGSVNLNGVGPLTLSTNSSFNNLIYSGGPTLTLMTPLTVTGALTVAVATFPQWSRYHGFRPNHDHRQRVGEHRRKSRASHESRGWSVFESW